MKKMTYFVMALALVLGFTQCKKEQIEPQSESNDVHITLDLKKGGSNGSRVEVDPPHVTFEEGDQILVGYNNAYVGTLIHNGTRFEGNIDATVNGTQKLYFYFVGNKNKTGAEISVGDNTYTVDISDQMEELPVLSFSASNEDFVGAGSYTAVLQNQCALVEFTTASTTAPVHVGGLFTEAQIDFAAHSITHTNTTGFVNLYPDADDNTAKWAVLLPQTGFENAEAAIAHVGYTTTIPAIPAIEADAFITGDAAISISTQSNIVYLDWLTSDYTAANGQTLKGTLSGNYQISIAADATVTLRNANITSLTDADYAGITCDYDATIILEGTNTVVGGLSSGWGDYPGIFIAEDHTLTIDGTGTLYAKCGALDEGSGDACGIGGGYDLHCGNINIQGGTIIATGGEFHAGIGGGDTEENDDAIRCGDITISGGTVTATGGENAAGIGSGNQGSCGDITISGGTVTAIGGENAAGIGSGSFGTCGDIKINDGTVTATGGADATGIGSGGSGSCGDISISGGTVTATGVAKAAGIGSGYIGTCGDITITSGVTRVTATKGTGAPNSIGAGRNGYCGTVEIGGTVYYQNNAYVGTGSTYLTQSPLIYPTPTPSAPTGAINGLFTINADGDQVWFSQGNLQATTTNGGTNWSWAFAENQYDRIGNATANNAINGNGTVSNNGTVDLFGWSTTANFYGINNNSSDYSGDFVDWGANAISNGDNQPNVWRTLTKDEWGYLFNNRTTAAGTAPSIGGIDDARFVRAYLFGTKHGVILFPDNYVHPAGVAYPTGINQTDNTIWNANTYSAADWSKMEQAGAVFLTVAGGRLGGSIVNVDIYGLYRSATSYSSTLAYCVQFNNTSLDAVYYNYNRYFGASVRLVRDAE